MSLGWIEHVDDRVKYYPYHRIENGKENCIKETQKKNTKERNSKSRPAQFFKPTNSFIMFRSLVWRPFR